MLQPGFLAIGVAAVLDAGYFDVRVEVAEHDPMILAAEPVQGRVYVLQALYITVLGIKESG
jgi:hypothetical protein